MLPDRDSAVMDHSTGAEHRSRAFQITPSVALSLSLSKVRWVVAVKTPRRALARVLHCLRPPVCIRVGKTLMFLSGLHEVRGNRRGMKRGVGRGGAGGSKN